MTMQKVSVNVEIDANVKDQAVKLLDQAGIDMSTAFDLFLRQIIEKQCLPLEPEIPRTYSERILYHIERLGIPTITLEVNDEGQILVDKDKDPDLYDWAVNG